MFNQAVIVRKAVMEKVGGYNESLWVMEDHDLALRLALEGPWAFIAEPLVTWHHGSEGSLSHTVKKNPLRLQEANRLIYEGLLDQIPSNDTALRSKINGRLRGVRRKTQIAQLMEHRHGVPRALGRGMNLLAHYGERIAARVKSRAAMQVGMPAG